LTNRDLSALIAKVTGDGSTRDDVLSLLNAASLLESETGQAVRQARDVAGQWILSNGPVQSGNMRWTMATGKSYKCRSNSDAISKLLAAAAEKRPEADAWSVVEECLSANAIKPGAARTLLGNAFGEVFDTVQSTELKLTKTNTDFIKSKKGNS
jgi:hypothetical protein